jgi:hypothetical protein
MYCQVCNRLKENIEFSDPDLQICDSCNMCIPEEEKVFTGQMSLFDEYNFLINRINHSKGTNYQHFK